MSRFKFWHVYLGHTITVVKGLTVPMWDRSAKGWLYKCECGRTWAR